MRAVVFLALAGTAFAQKFELADIHLSEPNTMAEMRVHFAHSRYELRNATLVDLIRTAWNVDAENVAGGPDFLDTRRFDVIAAAPTTASPDTLHAMLQQLLKERFQLVVHNGEKDRPAYAITLIKKTEMQPADGSETSGCNLRPGQKPAPRDGSGAEPVTFDCRNMTMATLAKALSNIREASGYVYNYPVLDRTGLDGVWNFSLKWTPRVTYFPGPAAGEPITLFDAFGKLGLKLARVKVRSPVIAVDSVNEKPTPNPPGTADQPALRPEFEVADIKEDRDRPECSNIGIRRGGEIDIYMTVKGLIAEAWGEMNRHRIVGLPKSDGPCWAIHARAPTEQDAVAGWVGPVWNGVDIDTMRRMVRSLLIDRFGLVAHDDDHAIPGYALIAAKPKLRKADPSNRPGCREGPGADGKDPRLTNPMASRLISCRNVTLAQFAIEMNDLMYGALPVVDATGIAGRYDMTLNFSPPSALQGAVSRDADGAITASEPNGAISIFDAVSRQLGLKLESRDVTTGVLVIDHVNETPTEN
jgi:uncharacterized protein (TIGR03435 family)